MSRLHFRGFISILLSLAFCIVVVTGLVLWLAHAPQTFGISKGVWKHSHIFVSLLLLVAGTIHLGLNWSIYWNYLWNGAAHRLNQKREMALSLVIVALILATATLDDHGNQGPFAAMSLQEIVRKSEKPLDQIVSVLKQEGIDVHNPTDSVLEIAKHNNRSPDIVLAVLQREIPGAMRLTPKEH
jgi:hypothetical protein